MLLGTAKKRKKLQFNYPTIHTLALSNKLQLENECDTRKT